MILCRVWLVSDGLCRAYQLVLLVSEAVYLKQPETPRPSPTQAPSRWGACFTKRLSLELI